MMTPVTSAIALLCSLLLTLRSAAGSLPAAPSYPVFGTKRYTRGNLIPTSEYGGGSGALSGALGLPVYHRLPTGRYYDAPLTSPQYFPFAPYQQMQPSSSDYYDDTGYYGDGAKSFYYLPPPPQPQSQHLRYQRNNERYTSYGLPTYRGEYKPTPYYYAHGPSYSYTDDHESSNPLDDLHEEMLQEDERERAMDYYPVGQEQWYESPSRPDSAFLRNLILYNQQLQNFNRGTPMQQQQRSMIDGSNEDDFEEYDEPEQDYEYDGAIPDPEPGYDSYYGAGYAAPDAGTRYETSGGNSASSNRDALSKLNSLRSSMAMNHIDDEDDEEVQELKSLIHQQKSSQQRLPPMFVDKMAPFVLKNQQYPAPPTTSSSYQKQHPAQYQIQQQQQQHKQAQEQQQRQQQQQKQQQQQLLQQQQQLFQEQQREQQRLKELQLQQQQKQERELKQQQLLRTLSSDYQPAYEPTDNWQKDSPSYNAYDYDNEYDDGSWSHWDRKRNVQPKKATFASKTTPQETTTTKATITAKPAGASVPTSTTSAPVTIKAVAHQPGQKEVVLPRPTNPRNAFSATLLNAVDPSTAHQQQHGVMKVDEGSMAKQMKSSKIYDTIKAMVNMRQHMEDADLRQQLEHQKQLAHIRKRFVSNEESLVQQLDGLKRSA
ncbi:probable serine/threonine-protein kinase fhkB [Anopheles albimanus]|uniref:probable serine/threonine-protein kinase fhkB n=1 Tax=Anopheles albimanus TaxID=7167 RepID=UPI00163FE369|nr:probable serine/threonine-protein kinase fhkB [Anopheles albimanus]XP_035773669.1 probable serine/threonine-protein kinase fhkB [Anopheles albimanus]